MKIEHGTLRMERLDELQAGHVETTNLAECLAIQQHILAKAVLPQAGLAESVVAAVVTAATVAKSVGISRQMNEIGRALQEALGQSPQRAELLSRLAAHPSDTVRSWAAFALAHVWGDQPLNELLERVRPFAGDHHFGVREWAWLAVRPRVAVEIEQAIEHLVGWTRDRDANIRRFASESTRPRGVWCAHIAKLKKQPVMGERLLTPLRADPSRYVQDSVANWINDASKSSPEWARALCDRWLIDSPCTDTERIVNRALRSLK